MKKGKKKDGYKPSTKELIISDVANQVAKHASDKEKAAKDNTYDADKKLIWHANQIICIQILICAL